MSTLQENRTLDYEEERNKRIRILEERLEEYQKYIDINHKEIERLNRENEKLKKGLNKLLQLNKYMVNFSSKKAISKLLVKQWDLIYELLEGRPRGIMHGSKGADKK